MQQVKIYTASPSDLSPPVQSESFCVDLVLASDYLELEEKFMALAAENAGLKAAKEIIRHLNVNREEANFCGIDDCYIDDAVAAMITPATDAFLNEIRASALPENIAEIIDSGDLETICWQHEHYKAEDYRLALYRFREDRVAQSRQEAAQ